MGDELEIDLVAGEIRNMTAGPRGGGGGAGPARGGVDHTPAA